MANAKLLDGLFGVNEALPGQEPQTPRRATRQYTGDGIAWALSDDPDTQRTTVHATLAPTATQKISSLFGPSAIVWITDPQYVARTGTAVSSWIDTSGLWLLGDLLGGITYEPTGWAGTKPSIVLANASSALYSTQTPLATFVSGNDRPFTLFGLFQLTATTDTNTVLCGWVNSGTPTRCCVMRGQATGVAPAFARITDGTTLVQLLPAGSPNTIRHSFGWIRHGATASLYQDGAALLSEAALDTGNVVGLNRFGIGHIGVSDLPGATVARWRMLVLIDRAIGPLEMANLQAAALAQSG